MHNLVNINKAFTHQSQQCLTWLCCLAAWLRLPHHLLWACPWVLEPSGLPLRFLQNATRQVAAGATTALGCTKTTAAGKTGTQLCRFIPSPQFLLEFALGMSPAGVKALCLPLCNAAQHQWMRRSCWQKPPSWPTRETLMSLHWGSDFACWVLKTPAVGDEGPSQR